MKIVLSGGPEGFFLSSALCKKLDLWDPWDDRHRTNPDVIKEVEADPFWAGPVRSNLYVVEIPDTATDWTILGEDDGEIVFYVVNGKIKTAW